MVSLENCNYLEVGTYLGGSFVAAMYGNNFKTAYAVDNWSEFDGNREKFFNTIKTCGCENYNFKLIDKNSWTVTQEDVPDLIDVYMYDGKHSHTDQKLAITHYTKFLAKYAIIMVDDWVITEWGVQSGTYEGFAEMGLKVHYKNEIPLVNSRGNLHIGGDTFWNGCGVFVVERTDI